MTRLATEGHRQATFLAIVAESGTSAGPCPPYATGGVTQRPLRWCRPSKPAGLQKRYFAYCRLDRLLRERQVLAAWHEVGLDRLFIGIETISDEGMRDFNTRLKMTQVEAGLTAARELGIEVWGQFIVDQEFTRRGFKHPVRFFERYQIDRPSSTI